MEKFGRLMLSRPLKVFLSCILRFDCYSHQFVRNLSYLYSVDGHRLDGVASYTFQSRLIKYLRTDIKYKQNSVQLDLKELLPLKELINGSNIRHFTHEQLAYYIYQLSEERNQWQSYSVESVLQGLDEECCTRFGNMDRRNVLQFLDAWFYVLPHRLPSLRFYSLFMNSTSVWLPVSNYSLQDIIHPMFFLGLQKQSGQGICECLQRIDSVLSSDVSVEELCILTSAAYKTSTKLTSLRLLELICSVINANIHKFLSDEPVLVTLIKSLRHAQFHSYSLMDNIARNITLDKSSLNNLNFTAKVHLMALYANASYTNDNLIQNLISHCINDLKSLDLGEKKDYLHVRPRVKDISRFLWAVSCLGYDLNSEIIEKIVIPQLIERVKKGEFSECPEEIINCILSVWMMGYRPEELFGRAVSKQAMKRLTSKNRFRYNSRLMLLLRCVDIEMPHLLRLHHLQWKPMRLAHANMEKHLKKRPVFQNVFLNIKCLSKNLKYEDVSVEFSIPNLYIAGIVVRNISGDVLHIEVLDQTVCLYKSSKPLGLMKLKLRLLKALGRDVFIINHEDIGSMSDAGSLLMFLEDELKKYTRQL